MNIVIIEDENTISQKVSEILNENGFNISYVKLYEIENEQKMMAKIKLADVVINISYNMVLESQIGFANEYINKFKTLISIIKKLDKKPKLFIATSFISIYNNKDMHTEMDILYNNNYLSNLAMSIEDEVSSLKEDNIRSAVIRLPLVLDNKSFLNKLLGIYKYKASIKRIKPKKFLSWVSSNDISRVVEFIVKDDSKEGVFNVVSPKMTHNKEMLDFLKSKYGKSFINLPNYMLTGCMKNYIDLFESLKVQPKRLLDYGFKFEDKILTTYINNIVK